MCLTIIWTSSAGICQSVWFCPDGFVHMVFVVFMFVFRTCNFCASRAYDWSVLWGMLDFNAILPIGCFSNSMLDVVSTYIAFILAARVFFSLRFLFHNLYSEVHDWWANAIGMKSLQAVSIFTSHEVNCTAGRRNVVDDVIEPWKSWSTRMCFRSSRKVSSRLGGCSPRIVSQSRIATSTWGGAATWRFFKVSAQEWSLPLGSTLLLTSSYRLVKPSQTDFVQ
jgi:hypothetical protein